MNSHLFYAFSRLTSLGPDAAPYFRNGRFELPPSFSWGSRTGTQPTFAARGCCFTENLVTDVTGSITKVKGRHTAKAGVFYEYSYKPQDPNVDYRGTVNFGNSTDNPLDSQFGFANAALGIFSQYSRPAATSKASISIRTWRGTCRTTGR